MSTAFFPFPPPTSIVVQIHRKDLGLFGTGDFPLAAATLEAGDYLLLAKVSVRNEGPGIQMIEVVIDAGSESDVNNTHMMEFSDLSIPSMLGVHLTKRTSVQVRIRNLGPNQILVTNAVLAAILVDGLVLSSS